MASEKPTASIHWQSSIHRRASFRQKWLIRRQSSLRPAPAATSDDSERRAQGELPLR